MRLLLFSSILGLVLVGSALSMSCRHDRGPVITQSDLDSVKRAGFVQGFKTAEIAFVDDYRTRAEESGNWHNLAGEVASADNSTKAGGEYKQACLVIKFDEWALEPWFRDLPNFVAEHFFPPGKPLEWSAPDSVVIIPGNVDSVNIPTQDLRGAGAGMTQRGGGGL